MRKLKLWRGSGTWPRDDWWQGGLKPNSLAPESLTKRYCILKLNRRLLPFYLAILMSLSWVKQLQDLLIFLHISWFSGSVSHPSLGRLEFLCVIHSRWGTRSIRGFKCACEVNLSLLYSVLSHKKSKLQAVLIFQSGSQNGTKTWTWPTTWNQGKWLWVVSMEKKI